jgi:hypothetical protein
MFDLKKLFCITICLMVAGTAFAANFAPTVMDITVPETVLYNFDGSDIEIDLNVSGVGGAFWLIINTKGQADNINMVQNGFLGWHTVNKIDTTVYISSQLTRSAGSSKITWDGKDNDGGTVAAGEYDYYVYGYDNVNARIPACMFMQAGAGWRSHYTRVVQYDASGNPMAAPWLSSTNQATGNYTYLGEAGKNAAVTRWPLGGDPEDINNLQWTDTSAVYPAYPPNNDTYLFSSGTAWDPADQSVFYNVAHDVAGARATLLKWSFVNNGSAVLDEEWGGWDNIELEKHMPLGYWSEPMSCMTDGDYIYVGDGEQTGVATNAFWNWLYCYNWDAEEEFSINMAEYYMPDDPSPVETKNCGFLKLSAGIKQNQIMAGTMGCCMHQFIETTALLAGDDEEASYLRWRNGQGDFYYDVYWQADAATPWGCLNNSERTSHRIDTVWSDANGFIVTWATFIGNFSHGVETQDGTSLLGGGLMAYADDGLGESDPYRGGGTIVDNGGNFDGMYVNSAPPITFGVHEVYFVANASAHGVITNDVAVEEDAAAAFAVSQNSPNPFNPTTSINFTLPVDGNVSVEVFNVAGQKVDTLVDDYMNAGQHNVVWDAAGFSNGVYFYTVKSGEFAKTMKMTLLK